MIAHRHFNFRSRRPASLNFSVRPEGWLHRWLLSGRFFLILFFVAPAYSSDVAALQLQSAAQVDGEGIFLQQIVKSATVLPALKLCASPAFGKTLDLTAAQINDLLVKQSSELATTNWSGADVIHISRASRPYDDAAMLALLTETFQKQYVKDKGDLELSFTQPWSAVALPDEPLTLRIVEAPASGVSTSFITRFEVCTAQETIATFQASLQAHVWRDLWVAHTPASRGTVVAAADLGRERRDVINLHEVPATLDPTDETLEFADSVSPGFAVLARDLKPKSVIHRGQTADARLEDGALTIKLKVVALEDGAPGQLIKLRNPVSSRFLSGRVVDDQTVLISL
jgi:flagella basal body P-ring formation protein FlgA